MNHFRVDSTEPDETLIRQAVAVLRGGGVVAYPTETVYGLGVDPRSDSAVSRLLSLKARDASAPIALIAASASDAETAGMFGPAEKRLAGTFWPGPLTIVVPASPAMSPLLSGRRTLGVRVSAHPVARALARAFGGCITATSANVSGRPAANSPGEVAVSLGDRIDMLIDAGPTPGGPPSTIVEIVDGKPRLHRAGAVAWDRVLESLK